MKYPLVHLPRRALSQAPERQQLLAVESHVSAEYEPGYGLLGVSLAALQKIELGAVLEDSPERRDVHVLEHRLAAVLLGQLRLPLDLEVVVGAPCIGSDVLWLMSWERPATSTRKNSSYESSSLSLGSLERHW